MTLIREQDRVRLISRRGHAWAQQFPLIVESALELRPKHSVINGEIVVLDKNGVSDFDALHSRKHDKRAIELKKGDHGRRSDLLLNS
jgi:bifunctional non-homologous end joining protein LigD